MNSSPINLFWFRRDLRLKDNHGLFQALRSGSPTLCLFIFDTEILGKLKNKKDKRLQFIHSQLQEINNELQKKGSCLITEHGKPQDTWKKLIKKYKINGVYTNHDYEPYATQRDKDVQELLEGHKIAFNSYKDQCIFEKEDILKDDGKPYTVFTPYKKKWLKNFKKKNLETYESEKHLGNLLPLKPQKIISLKDLGFEEVSFEEPKRVFKKDLLIKYDKNRNFPYLDATSHLGVHLRFGTVSVRKSMEVAFNTNETWLSELIWREFFMQILWHFPHVVKGAFRPQYDKIKWLNNKKHFNAWCEGKTGYPMVDAGMRELNETGYMHNRVRMVTASFLTKHLLIDWRWGEAYFAEKLLDFELSANNGNWQWAAGTGCDAAPYFRVFNPEEQIKKFDSDLKYVKKWVPEFGTDKYPEPLVEHKMARLRALRAYKEALK